jgi:hypothetical protein
MSVGVPDLLVIVIDGNCTTASQKRREIEKIVHQSVFPRCVIGCPDPHVERWCFADADAFRSVVGVEVPRDPGKCERDLYKALLQDALRTAALPVLTTEMEVAPEIVDASDLQVFDRTQPSLGSFVQELRSEFKLIASSSSTTDATR